MTTSRRRLLAAATLAVAGVIGAQLVAVATATAAGNAPDGGAYGTDAATTSSSLPALVRDHTAKLTGALAGSTHLRVSVGLKTRNMSGQEAFLAALQNKTSPLYHHYLTAAQWNAAYAPTPAQEAQVLDWAKANGLTVTKRYSNRMLVDIDATAAQLESALHVGLGVYSAAGKSFYSNDKDPSLPAGVSSVVSSVDGLNDAATLSTSFAADRLAPQKQYSAGPVEQAGASAHANGSSTSLAAAVAANAAKSAGGTPSPSITGGSYDPTDVYSSQMYDENALHNVAPCCNPTHLSQAGPTTSIAIASVGTQQFSDIQGFQSRYSYLAYDINESYIDGTPACCDGEGTMDVEWAMSLANSFGSYLDTAHVYLFDGVNAQISTFNDIYNTILTDDVA